MSQEITAISHPFEYNIDQKYNYDYSLNSPETIYKKYDMHDPIFRQSTELSNEGAFYKHAKCINLYGSISPHGGIIDTPNMINLPLKLHQKRTVFHMEYLENYKQRLVDENILILSDNVGSGKSYCMLSLIANKRETNMYPNKYYIRNDINTENTYGHYLNGIYKADNCIEFKSNLIVVPHGVYTQWSKYISLNTSIPYIGLSSLVDIKLVGSSKEDIINKLNSVYIVLIKSTIYTDFINYLSSYDLKQEVSIRNVEYKYSEQEEEPYYNENNKNICIKTPFIDKSKIIESFSHIYEDFIDKLEEANKDNIDDIFKSYKSAIDIQHEKYKKSLSIIDSNIRYTDTVKIVSGFIFQRIIFDEADSIKIPNCQHYIGKITWLITSSFFSLLYDSRTSVFDPDSNSYNNNISNGITGCTILKDCMRRINSYYNYRYIDKRFRIFSIIVRNHPEFVKMSIDIPPPIANLIRCYTPISYNVVHNALGQDIIKALNAGDMDAVAGILGYEINTENDIIDSVTKSLNDKKNEVINNKNIKKHEYSLLELEKNTAKNDYDRVKEIYKDIPPDNRPIEFEDIKRVYYNINSKISYVEKVIEGYDIELKDIEAKIHNIIERLKDPTAKTCPICMDNIKIACIAICCKNLFCVDCIEGAIKYNKSCPLCRAKIDKSQLHIIKDTEKDELINDMVLLDKLDVLSEYLLINSTKRILIFSEYERTFELIEKRLTQLGIAFGRIMGNTSQINKTIEAYKQNKTQVLMLNAKYFGAGINLQMTDDIFVYHRMSSDLEKQVVGRAQRIGRTEALKIHYLCYDNEYHIDNYNESINQNHIIQQ